MRFIIVIILVIVVISNEINCQYMRRRSKMNNNNNNNNNISSSSNNIPITTVSLNKNELNDLTTTTTTTTTTEEYIASVTEAISTMPSIKNNSTVVQSKISGLPSSLSASVGTTTQSNTSSTSLNMNLLPLPPGASAVLVKPTKYHYYPHNQHIYLLPECAIQQVCNAVYVRLNWTQPLCACPSRYRDPCSASLNSDDLHTTKLITGSTPQSALTLVKTCEPVADMRLCRSPRDWSLLALQNIRTGKSHYLVICRCPESSILEGPMSHDQPTYASVPGIRVYGMMCVQDKLRNTISRTEKSLSLPSLPWKKIIEVYRTAKWD